MMGPNLEVLVMQGSADLQAYGNALPNTITGNSGNNLIDGGAGADTMAGGAGDDLYYVDNASDGVMENASEGTDTVFSSAHFRVGANIENLVLQGSADLQAGGNSLNNVIYGNAGRNILDGDAGADVMVGGAGDDVYYVDNAGDQVFENPGEGTDSMFSTVHFRLPANVEKLVLQGSADLQAAGNSLNNKIFGNAGNNIIDGDAGHRHHDRGRRQRRLLRRQCRRRRGRECQRGQRHGVLERTLPAGGEYRECWCCKAAPTCRPTATACNNVIYGNTGSNILDGDAGADAMIGGAGNDLYFVDNAGDGVVENASEGTDTVFSSAHFALSANVEYLVLQGSADLQGYGNGLVNTLYGNAGSNILDGVPAPTLMFGGAGNDVYFVDNAGDVRDRECRRGHRHGVLERALRGCRRTWRHLVLQGSADLQGYGNSLVNVIHRQRRQQHPRRRRRRRRDVRRRRQRRLFRRQWRRPGVSRTPARATTRCSRPRTCGCRRTWRTWSCKAAATCRPMATA